MNTKSILGVVMIFLVITSGPIYLPTITALSDLNNNSILMEDRETETPTLPSEENTLPHRNVTIQINADLIEGTQPLFVTFTVKITNADYFGGILYYSWDFDGDGYDDYACLDSGNTTHVYYNTDNNIDAVFTAHLRDGSKASKLVNLRPAPVDHSKWFEIKKMGLTKIGIRTDGSIVIFDEKNWILFKITSSTMEKKDTHISYSKNNVFSLLSFDIGEYYINTTIKLGVAGRAEFTIEEYDKTGNKIQIQTNYKLESQNGITRIGRLDYTKIDNTKLVNGLVQFTAGNHDPWTDQGITPYGEYFKSINEYVSMYTGFLNIIQNDILVPGRGMDFNIKRVYALPSTFEDGVPAQTFDYSYQDFPLAPIGNGWQFGWPWIEYDETGPTYIHFSNGQRYLYEGSGLQGTKYKSGDYFKLYNHTNGNLTLYTVDGTKYSYSNSSDLYKLKSITDKTNNRIKFQYENDKISRIIDTTNRSYTFNYNEQGYVANITYGDKLISYLYKSGKTGYNLVEFVDQLNRTTYYDHYDDYIIGRIRYPSGGSSKYSYHTYTEEDYTRYRVFENHITNGYNSTLRKYIYSGDFYGITSTNIKYYASDSDYVKKIYNVFTSSTFSKSIYDEKDEEELLEKTIKIISEDKRVVTLRDYITSTNYKEKISRYDDWSNIVYIKNFNNYKYYYSYANTANASVFVDSAGEQINDFSDNFYSLSIDENIHNLLMGDACYQNKENSLKLESYYNYTNNGLLIETKELNLNKWVKDKYFYDEYGNLIKNINSLNETKYYEYNSTYNHAYLTASKQLLSSDYNPDQNITSLFKYDIITGCVITSVDPLGNITRYFYDDCNRLTNITYPLVNGERASKTYEYHDVGSYPLSSGLTKVVDTYGSKWTHTQTFSEKGRRWVFYHTTDNPDDLLYTSSDNGGYTWKTSTKIYTDGEEWDIYFDGTYVHVTFSTGNNGESIYYKRGLPCSNGNIIWNSTRGVAGPGAGRRFDDPQIIATDNYIWISVTRWNEPYDYDLFVYQSSSMNGGWTQTQGTLIKNTSARSYVKFANLGEDRLYVAYEVGTYGVTTQLAGLLWNGTQWLDEEIIDESVDWISPFDVSYTGDKVWVFYADRSNTYAKTIIRDFNGTWHSSFNQFTPGGDRSVAITRGEIEGTFYVFWGRNTSPYGISYRYYDGQQWSEVISLNDCETNINPEDSLSASTDIHDRELSLIYHINSPSMIVQDYLCFGEKIDNYIVLYDENHNKLIKYYNGLNQLIKIERYNETILYSVEKYNYNYLGSISSHINALNQTYLYEYDALGHLINTNNPDGTEYQIEYDHMGNQKTIIDEEERKKDLIYNSIDQLITVKEYYSDVEYYETGYKYDGQNNIVTIEDSLNRRTSYYYDQNNNPVLIIYPDLLIEKMTYDSAGKVITKKTRDGQIITYDYDSLDRLINTTYNSDIDDNWLNNWTYRKGILLRNEKNILQDYQIKIIIHRDTGADTSNNIYLEDKCKNDYSDIRFTNVTGINLPYWIQESDNTTATIWIKVDKINYPQDTLIFLYYGNVNASSVQSGEDTWIRYEDWESYYDGAQLPLGDFSKLYSPYIIEVDDDTQVLEGSYSLYSYDPGSTKTNGIKWNFDDINDGGYRFLSSFYIDSSQYSNKYWWMLWKDDSETTSVCLLYQEPNYLQYYYSGAKNTAFTPNKDEWHMIEVCSEIGTTKFELGVDGSNRYKYSYRNPLCGFDYCEIDASTRTDKFKGNFDIFAVGQFISNEPIINSIGSEEMRVNQSLIKNSEILDYDLKSNIIKTTYNNITINYIYDSRNRLIKETYEVWDAIYSIGYRYDKKGNIVAITYPDENVVSLRYDTLDRIGNVDGYASFRYSLTDNIDRIRYTNGVQTAYSYDNRNRPVNIETMNGVTPLMNLTYTYDKTGSVTSINNGTYTEYYTYDLLDRLNGTSGPWGTIDYTYDPVGNRLSKSVQGGSTITYTYDNMDRITSATGLGFDWDTNGNMVYKHDGVDAWNYTFDPLNRLTKVQKNDVLSALYRYDAGGRRVRSWDAVDGVTDYVYNGLNVIDEVNGGVHEKHIYAGGMHIASNTTGSVEYYHADHLGSTRLKTAANGSVIYESNYEPFGPSSDESGSEDYRYTGKPEDSTGLYYYGARYYDPDTGRFISRDTVIGEYEKPQTLNRYVYCRNNPQKYVDPTGNWYFKIGISFNKGIPFGPCQISEQRGIGLAIANSKEKGFEMGDYTERGPSGNVGFGSGSSRILSLSWEINKYDTSLEDIAGRGWDYSAEAVISPMSVSIGYSGSVDEDGNIDLSEPSLIESISFGTGYQIGGSTSFVNTEVNSWTLYSPDWGDPSYPICYPVNLE